MESYPQFPFLIAAVLFALAIIVGIAAIIYIPRELRRTSRLSNTPTAQPSRVVTFQSEPFRAQSPPITAKPSSVPKDNARLYPRRKLTNAESRFYDFLNETLEGKYIIDTKTPLKDIFKRYGWLDKRLYTMHTRGHADFLVLDPAFKNTLLAIELDDSSHDTPRRQDADTRKDELFRRANVKLLRIRTGIIWGDVERKAIRDALPPRKS